MVLLVTARAVAFLAAPVLIVSLVMEATESAAVCTGKIQPPMLAILVA
jgi:hypothetical protein